MIRRVAPDLFGVHPLLILTRRVGEALKIGDDITVAVLGVKGLQVRIGVDAPRDVKVHREEIYDKIQAEMQRGRRPNRDNGCPSR